MVTWAVIAALASAFCFALAASLQQREALRTQEYGVADPRLLMKLARRPLWLAGIVADILAAVLHVVALGLGSITLVQPLGVTGLLFAIPLVALLRRSRVRGRDLLAAIVVLIGLVLLLRLFPTAVESSPAGLSACLWIVVATLLLNAGCAIAAHVAPGRPRALLLAAAAGIAFGIVAVLVRVLLQGLGHSGRTPVTVTAAISIVVLALVGYLLLQNAYRAGHFAASLATAVVVDPLAAIAASAILLRESLPTGSGHLAVAGLAGALVVGGVAMLVRSPAQLFVAQEPTPISLGSTGCPGSTGSPGSTDR
ncbi:drug/metabolite transporter (DMT)-like permease [Nakamurella sp. UYEF19]|uniref:DMT family transporter n=1 Tax=Nakamurella sp. UYEF19 TaxID=1756392 RepID=UPI00339739EC